MTRSLRDYLAETEAWINSPAVGDEFAINIREECLIESHIIEAAGDTLVLRADDAMLDLLEQYHMLEDVNEAIRRYGAVGSSPGMGYALGERSFEDAAQKPGIIDKPQQEPPIDIDPEAVGTIKELPDGTRLERTATGWNTVTGPNPSRPKAMEDRELMQRMLELAGMPNAAHNDPLAAKAADLAAVGTEQDPTTATTIDESVMSEIDMDLRHIAKTESFDALQDAIGGQFGASTKRYLEDLMMDVARDNRLHYDDDIDDIMELVMDRIVDIYAEELDEAEYQGRKVQLNKPMQGDVAKFKVYVKDPKTGNVKKVNFGDKTMRIKKSNPARRRSFRARHRCENPGPKTKARYWSCRKW
jgi:hypothetical protein